MDLAGKVALVTGAANGVGRATSERFAAAGLAVVMADIRKDTLEGAARDIAARCPGDLLPLAVDVADPAQVETMVRAAVTRYGRIDYLVNNAAICPIVPWAEATLEVWNRILAVNVTGMWLCTRAVVPHMQARRFGRIIFLSSESAYSGSLLSHVAYGVSKAGVIPLMKVVAKTFAADGILANAIAPGPIDTPMGHSFGEDFWALADRKTLVKRHGSPFEVADAVLFLASEQSSFITGQVLRVNGGSNLA